MDSTTVKVRNALHEEFPRTDPTMRVWGDPGALAAALLPALPGRRPTALARALAGCESAAQRQLTPLLGIDAAGPLQEGRVIYEVFQHAHDGSAIFLSASLIFRGAE